MTAHLNHQNSNAHHYALPKNEITNNQIFSAIGCSIDLFAWAVGYVHASIIHAIFK